MGRKRVQLIVVTGRPGAGKTSLCRRLMHELNGVANFHYLARDDIKRIYLAGLGLDHDEAPADTNQVVSDDFTTAMKQQLELGRNLIVDAAFQHPFWQQILVSFEAMVDIRLIICETSPEIALERYNQRLATTPNWQALHGRRRPDSLIIDYLTPTLGYPTKGIDTSSTDVDLAKLVSFCTESLH